VVIRTRALAIGVSSVRDLHFDARASLPTSLAFQVTTSFPWLSPLRLDACFDCVYLTWIGDLSKARRRVGLLCPGIARAIADSIAPSVTTAATLPPLPHVERSYHIAHRVVMWQRSTVCARARDQSAQL
jgi:hypothetical protein